MDPFKLQKDTLEKQISFFKKHFNIIRLEEYISSYSVNAKNREIHANSMVITIDDGYLDNYTIAYPILKKWNVPATIFLATDFIDKREWLWSDRLEYALLNTKKKEFQFPLNGEILDFQVGSFNEWHRTQLRIFHYCRTLAEGDKNQYLYDLFHHLGIRFLQETSGDYVPMTWGQIVEMKENGIEFGSHTCSHPILSRLSGERLRQEIGESKKQIEKRVMSKVKSFCIPHGTPEDYNGEVIDTIKESGYSCAVTTVPGFNPGNSPNLFELKRISVNGKEKKKIIKQLIFPGR
jgi:peptidoglycan/xylan/chitin deacetylase (PgdA/CDA1 family)